MKKKSGHRRRTKMVRRSRKNFRRTIKRKSLGKGRRHSTRRYSRVQRGGRINFLRWVSDTNGWAIMTPQYQETKAICQLGICTEKQ